MTEEMLQVLFRTDNKFDMDNFVSLKYAAIQAIIEKTQDGVRFVCCRVLDEECGIGEKAMLLEVLGLAG